MSWIDLKDELPPLVGDLFLMNRKWINEAYEAEYFIGRLKEYTKSWNKTDFIWIIDGKEVKGGITHFCQIPRTPQN